jgi:hypothetical protein
VNLKPKMTLDKLQLIATIVVSSNFKIRWLTWWNSGVHMRSALHFPATPFSDKDFESWLNQAVFWAGISTTVRFLISIPRLSELNMCEALEFSSSALTGSNFCPAMIFLVNFILRLKGSCRHRRGCLL